MGDKMMENKRGDIPITILVIGVIAICGLVIFSFYLYDEKVKKDFIVVEVLEEAKIIGEKISFYSENLEFSEEEIYEIFGIDQIDYLYVEGAGLSVKYNLPK